MRKKEGKVRFYQVGGAVRDMLLHKASQDKDFVVVGGTEQEMLNLGFKKVGKSFPVFLHPETGEEYALARREIKTGAGHRDFKFEFTPDISLEEDSVRRDFTCNALYLDEESGQIIDFHHGLEDISNRVLRHISEHFAEDPLRVLRMCRFAAKLNFSVAPATMDLCRQMVAGGAIKHLSRQRIWREMEKALADPNFYKFVLAARDCGALQQILPEVEALWSVPERTDYHPEGNSGEHTILSLKAASSNDSLVNMAVLLHDVGKTVTPKDKWPCHANHDVFADDIIVRLSSRLQIPRRYAGFSRFCAKHHMVAHWALETVQKEMAVLVRELMETGRDGDMERFICVMSADMHGRARPMRPEAEKNLQAVSESLRRLYQKASSVRLSEVPEFAAALSEFKAKKISVAELHRRQNEIMERLLFAEAKTG